MVTRAFHSSATSYKVDLTHPLIWIVDWAMVAAGHYAIVDLSDPNCIEYLTVKEYKELQRTVFAKDMSITILATPKERQPKPESITAPKPSEPSPPLSEAKSPHFSQQQSWWSFTSRRIIRKIRRSFSGNGLFKPDPKKFGPLLEGWMKDVWTWSGLPVHNSACHPYYLHSVSFLLRILRTRGSTGLVLTLKTSYLYLLKWAARTPVLDNRYFGYPIRLDRSGIPRWIPVGAREAIRKYDSKTLRFWLTVCYIYKAFEANWKPHLALKSIEAPRFDTSDPLNQKRLSRYRTFLNEFFIPMIGGLRRLPMTKLWDHPFFPTSAGPNGSPAIEFVHYDALAWKQEGEQLFPTLEAVAKFHKDTKFSELFKIALEDTSHSPNWKPSLKAVDRKLRNLCLGKIALLPEASGKIRPIAMVDYFTQRVLQPLHKDINSILEGMPQDGTMDQDRLLQDLKREHSLSQERLYISSLDISSATDMIPVQLYGILLEALYGDEIYSKQILELMTNRSFKVSWGSFSKRMSRHPLFKTVVRYTRGQPMGMYGSFALLALFHHSWIQFAAYESTGTSIKSYGVVGDDSVMFERNANQPVSKRYLHHCEEFGIPISMAKSFNSNTLWQFLSRVVVDGVEVSPLSLREELKIDTLEQRVERAQKAHLRNWQGEISLNNWLSKTIKLVLSHDEYISYVTSVRKGFLTPIARNVMCCLLSPDKSYADLVGMAVVPFNSFVQGLLGEIELLSTGTQCLTKPQAVDPRLRAVVSKELLRLLKLQWATLADDFRCKMQAIDNWMSVQTKFVQSQALQLRVYLELTQRIVNNDSCGSSSPLPDIFGGSDGFSGLSVLRRVSVDDQIRELTSLMNSFPHLIDVTNNACFETEFKQRRQPTMRASTTMRNIYFLINVLSRFFNVETGLVLRPTAGWSQTSMFSKGVRKQTKPSSLAVGA